MKAEEYMPGLGIRDVRRCCQCYGKYSCSRRCLSGPCEQVFFVGGPCCSRFSVDFDAVMNKCIKPLAALFSPWGATILFLSLANNTL
jgi:hypothetical protein